MKFISGYIWLYIKLSRGRDWIFVNKDFNYWKQKKSEILELAHNGYREPIEALGFEPKKLEKIRWLQRNQSEFLIAEIDQDGFLLSHFGPLKFAPTISVENYLPRKKSKVTVVSLHGNLGVKKLYSSKRRFIDELKALFYLSQAECNVPAIIDIDFDNLVITTSYILGRVLREALANEGALLRDRDMESLAANSETITNITWLYRIDEGKKVLHKIIDEQFVKNLLVELRKMHSIRFVWNDIKYGNIIIDEKSGQPFLIDFVTARHYPEIGDFLFRHLRDYDIELFNLHFDTINLTYKILAE